jgi:hypothetical protein
VVEASRRRRALGADGLVARAETVARLLDPLGLARVSNDELITLVVGDAPQ